MRYLIPIIICASAALVAATPDDCSLAATVTVTITSTITSGLSPSNPTTASTTGGTDDFMTIAITNAYTNALSLSLASDAGSPTPVGNPLANTIAQSSNTQYTFPTGWAGRIVVGPNLNENGSKIEASFTGPPDVDISYVDGYSVPITCSVNGTAVTGCNVDLFNEATCEDLVDGPVCLNPARMLADGPASDFFAVCAGAAYTFPNDNEANVGNLGSTLVSCCIGTSCEAPQRQNLPHPQFSPSLSLPTLSTQTIVNDGAPPYPTASRPYGVTVTGSGSTWVKSLLATPYPIPSGAAFNTAGTGSSFTVASSDASRSLLPLTNGPSATSTVWLTSTKWVAAKGVATKWAVTTIEV